MDAKIERNREIYEARLKGASFKELDSNEALLNVTRKDLQKCRNCGDVMIDLILKIADVIRCEEKG